MLVLTQEKLLEIVDGFAASIRVQLRARPLGVVVTDEWILDLARNMAGGLPGYEEEPGTCGFCQVTYEMSCSAIKEKHSLAETPVSVQG